MNGSIRIGTEIETQEMAIGCQSIEDQTTEKMAHPQGILPDGSIPSSQAGNTQAEALKPPAKKSPGDMNRPKRRATVMREIPLYILPAAPNCCIRAQGEKVYRIVIVRTHWHHYTIKVRCSTKKATMQTPASGSAVQVSSGEGSERI